MANFQGLDFLRLDELLSDEERLARDTVRDWVTREFLPVIQEHVRRDGSFPLELVPAIAELGLFGANLSGYGCAGMNNVAYGLVMQELERGDSGLRSFASVQGSEERRVGKECGYQCRSRWSPRRPRRRRACRW